MHLAAFCDAVELCRRRPTISFNNYNTKEFIKSPNYPNSYENSGYCSVYLRVQIPQTFIIKISEHVDECRPQQYTITDSRKQLSLCTALDDGAYSRTVYVFHTRAISGVLMFPIELRPGSGPAFNLSVTGKCFTYVQYVII